MKVKAKTNVKYDSKWYTPGDVFDVRKDDYPAMQDIAEKVAEEPVPVSEPNEETEARPASTRKRAAKTEK